MRAHVSDRLDTGIGAEVGDHRTNLDVGERGDEFFEPFTTTADDHEIVTVGAEPSRKRVYRCRTMRR